VKPVTFIDAATLDDAVAALAKGNGARVIAGGSDLLGMLKDGTAEYDELVSLGDIEALRQMEVTDAGMRIGAMVPIARLGLGAEFTGPYRILAEAARSVATPEIRNQGTVGGNLCQRPRCLHFRSALIDCYKKGGRDCPAADSPYQNYLSIFGGPNCYAVHASDLAPALIALDATVTLQGPHGARDLPLAAFLSGPEADFTRENVLQQGDVLTSVFVPAPAPSWRGTYVKARERTAGDFPIVSLAIGYELRDVAIANARVVLGAVAPVPLRMAAAEAVLNGQAPSEDVAAAAASTALQAASPLQHNGFKVDLARALIERNVVAVAQMHANGT
jgi:xanthine dehydrogenase YagS FAD-binding subunit